MVSYIEAKKIMRESFPVIDTVSKWFKFSESKFFPNYLPPNPLEYYQKRGEWPKKDGWADFLGRSPSEAIGLLNYSAAKAFIHQMEIKNEPEYIEFIKVFNIKNLPSSPSAFYFDDFIESEFYHQYTDYNLEQTIDYLKKNNINFSSKKEWEMYFVFSAPKGLTSPFSDKNFLNFKMFEKEFCRNE